MTWLVASRTLLVLLDDRQPVGFFEHAGKRFGVKANCSVESVEVEVANTATVGRLWSDNSEIEEGRKPGVKSTARVFRLSLIEGRLAKVDEQNFLLPQLVEPVGAKGEFQERADGETGCRKI